MLRKIPVFTEINFNAVLLQGRLSCIHNRGYTPFLSFASSSQKQWTKNLCHRIVYGRRLKGSEKQIVSKSFNLHIFMREHTAVQQHITSDRQLHKMSSITFSGNKECCSQCKAAPLFLAHTCPIVGMLVTKFIHYFFSFYKHFLCRWGINYDCFLSIFYFCTIITSHLPFFFVPI